MSYFLSVDNVFLHFGMYSVYSELAELTKMPGKVLKAKQIIWSKWRSNPSRGFLRT